MKKTDFDDKLQKLNKRVTSNKVNHVEAEKETTDLTKKVAQISEKGYEFLLHRMYFTENDGYQNFVVFTPMLSSLILDNNKKLTNWISTGMSSEKIKLFDTNLEPTMSNLDNDRGTLKFNNSVLVQKKNSLLYSNFTISILTLNFIYT